VHGAAESTKLVQFSHTLSECLACSPDITVTLCKINPRVRAVYECADHAIDQNLIHNYAVMHVIMSIRTVSVVTVPYRIMYARVYFICVHV